MISFHFFWLQNSTFLENLWYRPVVHQFRVSSVCVCVLCVVCMCHVRVLLCLTILLTLWVILDSRWLAFNLWKSPMGSWLWPLFNGAIFSTSGLVWCLAFLHCDFWSCECTHFRIRKPFEIIKKVLRDNTTSCFIQRVNVIVILLQTCRIIPTAVASLSNYFN